MVEAERKIAGKTGISSSLSIAKIAGLVNRVLLGVNISRRGAEAQRRDRGAGAVGNYFSSSLTRH
ncbi:hypothetical protein NIES3585_28670 [Nodularia sp. NIES-3585]|nr:hypothetical protein NIES3585_28670 [Nodularia sp. NIES-3585]